MDFKKKYELLEDDTIEVHGRKLYRIKVLMSFGRIHEGELGGYIEGEHNLSQALQDDCWICENSRVFEYARVFGDAYVSGESLIYGYARIYDEAEICNSNIYGKAEVFGAADVLDSLVYGTARIYDNAKVRYNSLVFDSAIIHDNAIVNGSNIRGNTHIGYSAVINHEYDFITISSSYNFTFFKSDHDMICVKSPYYSGDIKGFAKATKRIYSTERSRIFIKIARLAKRYLKAKID